MSSCLGEWRIGGEDVVCLGDDADDGGVAAVQVPAGNSGVQLVLDHRAFPGKLFLVNAWTH